MEVAGKRVRDIHNYGLLDVGGVLQHSSNIGVTKLTLMTAPDSLRALLHKVGFGEKTGAYFPGESAGTLPTYRRWNPFVLATLSFGYGLSTTLMQLAEAYTVFASYGIKRPVSLLRLDKTPQGQKVLEPKVAEAMLAMLERVTLPGGSATLAQIPGFRVAGKTGTVRLLGEHGYEENRHAGIFVGLAPRSAPRYVVAVVVNDIVGGEYYAGKTAAPVFSEVMAEVLRLENVPKDALNDG